jgi:hypothetical protein
VTEDKAISFKKIPNPPKKCIFCGGGNLSKEHIAAKWMRHYISDEGSSTDHFVAGYSLSEPNNEPSLQYLNRGNLNLKGEHRSRTLKVVCKSCNEGWMGSIQKNAGPILKPMLRDKWQFLNNEDQSYLSAWATLYTIIWEQADERTISLHQAERDAFKEKRLPTSNWTIWVGRNLDKGLGSYKTFHRGISLTPRANAEHITEICNFQMTAFSPGKTFFLTMSDNLSTIPPSKLEIIKDHALSLGLRQIWPITQGNILSNPFPSLGLGANDTRKVIEQISSILFS